nr:MAG TPA: hypothetical protein [Caudoviricetes sp.]
MLFKFIPKRTWIPTPQPCRVGFLIVCNLVAFLEESHLFYEPFTL